MGKGLINRGVALFLKRYFLHVLLVNSIGVATTLATSFRPESTPHAVLKKPTNPLFGQGA